MGSRQACGVALSAGLACAGAAWAQAGAEMELPSCVPGSPPLRVSAAAERAMLDLPDRRRFDDTAQARYPLYQRGGLVPTHVLMLRRGRHWQYVTLSPLGPRGGLCVTAVFAADRFDFTPGWVAKYQPSPAQRDD